ncbi:fimbria/pilus periplasmic chaperone [Novosphingobium sp. PhB165]|uniref:fimbria/pilus periplasmic chaperone n=1 Tax=Novosphingobium sp. PhB165 TaxID=2485105 RepID=UPI0010497D11|nr:fimbria/pilus periplasmic chaperone [Novosphingobium sp. PhB165]
MNSRFARHAAHALVSLTALLATATPALALNVQPVVVDLQTTGRRASAIVTLQNTFPDTVPVEVTVHPVNVVNGELQEDENAEGDDLLVFPSQATLAANQSQAFRVQWIGQPAAGESKHFYVTIAQLPVTMPDGQNTIQVLHRFKVLVSVGSASETPSLKIVEATIGKDAQGKPQPVVKVTNDGGTYGYLASNRMTVVERRGDGTEAYRKTFEPEEIRESMGLGLVPSKASRILPMNVELPDSSGTLSVELNSAGRK